MDPNLWDTTKAVLREKFVAVQSYLKKHEKAHINNLILHPVEAEEQQKCHSKVKFKNMNYNLKI